MNAKDISAKRFEKTALGYKPEEVEEYLKDVAIAYANAIKEKEDSEAKIIKLVEKINEYRNDEDAIRDALLVAQKQGNYILAQAKEEAAKLVSEAQAKRDAMMAEITSDCEAIKRAEVEKIALAIKEENEKLNAVAAASKTQIALHTEKLNNLKAEVSEFKKKMIILLGEQAKLVSGMPELSEEEIAKISKGEVKAEPAPAPVNTPVQEPAPVVEAPKFTTPSTPVAPVEKVEQPKFEPKKPAPKPSFGFDTTYKKQNFSASELKFGQHNNNN